MTAERLKQQRLPGTSTKLQEQIEAKAEAVKEHEIARMEAGEKEDKARAELTELMEQLGSETYPLDDEMEVVLKNTLKAYVRKRKKGGSQEAKGKKKAEGNGKRDA